MSWEVRLSRPDDVCGKKRRTRSHDGVGDNGSVLSTEAPPTEPGLCGTLRASDPATHGPTRRPTEVCGRGLGVEPTAGVKQELAPPVIGDGGYQASTEVFPPALGALMWKDAPATAVQAWTNIPRVMPADLHPLGPTVTEARATLVARIVELEDRLAQFLTCTDHRWCSGPMRSGCSHLVLRPGPDVWDYADLPDHFELAPPCVTGVDWLSGWLLTSDGGIPRGDEFSRLVRLMWLLVSDPERHVWPHIELLSSLCWCLTIVCTRLSEELREGDVWEGPALIPQLPNDPGPCSLSVGFWQTLASCTGDHRVPEAMGWIMKQGILYATERTHTTRGCPITRALRDMGGLSSSTFCPQGASSTPLHALQQAGATQAACWHIRVAANAAWLMFALARLRAGVRTIRGSGVFSAAATAFVRLRVDAYWEYSPYPLGRFSSSPSLLAKDDPKPLVVTEWLVDGMLSGDPALAVAAAWALAAVAAEAIPEGSGAGMEKAHAKTYVQRMMGSLSLVPSVATPSVLVAVQVLARRASSSPNTSRRSIPHDVADVPRGLREQEQGPELCVLGLNVLRRKTETMAAAAAAAKKVPGALCVGVAGNTMGGSPGSTSNRQGPFASSLAASRPPAVSGTRIGAETAASLSCTAELTLFIALARNNAEALGEDPDTCEWLVEWLLRRGCGVGEERVEVEDSLVAIRTLGVLGADSPTFRELVTASVHFGTLHGTVWGDARDLGVCAMLAEWALGCPPTFVDVLAGRCVAISAAIDTCRVWLCKLQAKSTRTGGAVASAADTGDVAFVPRPSTIAASEQDSWLVFLSLVVSLLFRGAPLEMVQSLLVDRGGLRVLVDAVVSPATRPFEQLAAAEVLRVLAQSKVYAVVFRKEFIRHAALFAPVLGPTSPCPSRVLQLLACLFMTVCGVDHNGTASPGHHSFRNIAEARQEVGRHKDVVMAVVAWTHTVNPRLTPEVNELLRAGMHRVFVAIQGSLPAAVCSAADDYLSKQGRTRSGAAFGV